MQLSRREFLGASALALGSGVVGRDSFGLENTRPDIVLIVIDTTRADRCSCLGYGRDTTPFLRELSGRGTLYTNAHSTSCWTVPAHASIFTGHYAIAHGVTQEDWTFAPPMKPLAQILKEAGYRTIGIAENPMLSKRRLFDAGFDVYHECFRIKKPVGIVAYDLFKQELAVGTGEGPTFTFVNLISPHQPYTPPSEILNSLLPGHPLKGARNDWREWYLGQRPGANRIEQLSGLYDAEICFADSIVRLMWEYLAAEGRGDDTLFIVTADHGENLGDHGHMDHAFCLYETLTRVPLIIQGPGFGGGRVESRAVQLQDLFPTILTQAGVELQDFPNQGITLSNSMPENRLLFNEYYYPTQALGAFKPEWRTNPLLDPYRRRLRAVTVNGQKLIWGSDGQHEVYDLAGDPGESCNLIGTELGKPIEENLLIALLETELKFQSVAQRSSAATGAHEEMDVDERQALEAIGYL